MSTILVVAHEALLFESALSRLSLWKARFLACQLVPSVESWIDWPGAWGSRGVPCEAVVV